MTVARVLVVEDNEQNLELTTFLLEEAGHDVLAVRSLDEARAALAAEVPDLVLLDMNVAGEDGLRLVDEIRHQPRLVRVPVLALTAHAMRGDRERFLEGGCDGYIAKPIDVRTFVATVEIHLPARDEL
ncbi:MAG: response regulator [Vicinamibacteria bacterium]|nr:response regulator [Vicinamibacteria bacterium]